MDAHDFVTLSVRREFTLPDGLEIEETLRGFLSVFTTGLRDGGCTMVGHIKGMIEDGGPSPLYFSITSLDSGPQYKGGPLRRGSGLTLSMNVIVAGIGGDDVASTLEDAMGRCLQA